MLSDTMAAGTSREDAERLPWLEAVEDEDGSQGPSAARIIGALLIGLAVIAAVIFGFFRLGNGGAGAGGEPQEIVAESSAYKERPAAAGGLEVEGEGDTAFAASEGADPNARINLDAIPEAPIAGAQGVSPAEQFKVRADAAAAQAVPNPALPDVANAGPAVPPTAMVTGSAVQLGAFSSNAAAQSAWKSMSTRFASLSPLTSSVVPASVNGKTLYRLRAGVASRADANLLCNKLMIAGESCVVI